MFSGSAPYVIAFFGAGTVSLLVAVFLYRRRAVPGSLHMALLNAAVSLWAFATAFRVAGSSLESMIFWHKVELLGMAPIGVTFFVFSARYVGRSEWVTGRRLVLLSLVPAITIVLGWTNELHHIHWAELYLVTGGEFPVLGEKTTTWWWIDTLYAYGLIIFAVLLLLGRFLEEPGLYRRQAASLIMAALLALSVDAVYIFGVTPEPALNLTPIAFSGVALILAWGFARYGLLDLVPAARDFIVKHMPDGLLVIDVRQRISDVNPAAEVLLGRDAKSLIGLDVKTALKDFPPLSRMALGGDPGEISLAGPEGERFYDVTVTALREGDRLRGYLLALRDITDRRRAEEALREAHAVLEQRVEERTAELKEAAEELEKSRAKLSHLLSASPTVIYSAGLSSELPLTFVGRNVREVLGYTPEELVGRTDFWSEHVHPEDLSEVRERIRVVREEGSAAMEYRLRHADGGYRWIYDQFRVTGGEGDGPLELVGTWLDVTDRREMEDRLRQSQKMEAVGLLAGGIAHDFNNLLTAVRGYAELLLAELDERDPRRADLQEIRNAANRATGLTRQLLAFSRRQVMKPQIFDLNSVIWGMEEMFRRTMGEDVRLVTELEPDLDHIRADPSQMEQVCMNLVLNARHAMPAGGTLTIRTENLTVAGGSAERRGLNPGSYVVLTVSDTGSGIDSRTRERLFEPFFSTKESGGTGLGLATVYGIVSQSGGHIEVDSVVGKGSTFRIFLPARSPAESPESAEGPALEPAAAPAEAALLIVEDEPAVRRLAARTLRGYGYEVFEAGDGAEGLDIFAGRPEISLLITDVVMPKMNGPELAREVRLRRPDLPVLYISGYAEQDIMQGEEGADINFLAKPFTGDDLAAKVSRLLRREPGREETSGPVPRSRG
ncbi:MAG: hypothetical protein Kow00129_02440 [Thermoleophilia bacterium]